MELPTRRSCRNVAIVCLLLSCLLVGMNWNAIVSASSLSVMSVNLRPINGTITGANNAYVAPGSDAYYALFETRVQLVASIRARNNELQQVLKLEKDYEKNIRRAIIVFLPLNSPKFNKELKAMLLSVGWMRTFQPAQIKTDFIVYTPPGGSAFPESIGCSKGNVRTSFADAEKCIIQEHVPLPERGGKPHVLDQYSNYVDSMLILSEFQFSKAYDVLLRSDMDVFITPAFATWSISKGLAMITGKGGYTVPSVEHHLKWVMEKKLSLKDNGIVNIGSTWVGQCEVLVAAAKLTISNMEWLHTQEFSEYEITASGTDGWPNWHWPVLLLYGGHIAINQVPQNQVFVSNFESSVVFDFPSSSTVPLPKSVIHIHCWHTDDLFSKFKFQAGFYKDLDLTAHMEMRTGADFAITMALSSDRLSPSQFATIATDNQKMKNKEWLRLTKA